jgi:hypothetical protein
MDTGQREQRFGLEPLVVVTTWHPGNLQDHDAMIDPLLRVVGSPTPTSLEKRPGLA